MTMTFRPIKAGSTDVSVIIRIVDSTDGTPETGVVYNTSGIDIQYRRDGATSTAITEATLADAAAAHSDGGFVHIGNGYYRVDLPDAAVATGANGVLVHGTVTGMIVIGTYVPLVKVDMGATVTSMPELGILHIGTLQSATATTAVIAAAASFSDDFLNGAVIAIVSGTGAGQSRLINDYAGASDTCTVDTWTTNPDNTSGYIIIAAPPASTSSPVPATVSSLGTDVITAASIASDAGTELASAVWGSATRTLTAGTNIALAKGTGVTGLNDLDAAGVRSAVGLSSANLETLLTAIDNFLDTEVAAILALLDDPRGEPGQGAPPVNPDLATKIDYLYKAWRNRSTQTATTYSLYADDGTTVDQKATVSDDGTTYVKGEIATGP